MYSKNKNEETFFNCPTVMKESRKRRGRKRLSKCESQKLSIQPARSPHLILCQINKILKDYIIFTLSHTIHSTN